MRFNCSYFILPLIGAALLMTSCGENSSPSEPEPAPTVKQYSIEQFYENISIGGGSFNDAEDKLLVNSNETGIYNVYEIDLASGELTQRTTSEEESFFAEAYFPGEDRFLYSYDQGGNENYKLAMMTPDGESTVLTPEDGARNGFGGWHRDGTHMYIMSNKRNPQYMDVYTMSMESIDADAAESTLLYENNDGLDLDLISNNDRYFVLTQTITNADSKMYLYDNETGEKTDISIHEGDANYGPQFFDLSDENLYYTTDEGSDFTYLAKRNIASGEVEKVYESDWDVWYAYESWNEKYRVIGINADAKTEVKIFDQGTGEEVNLPEIAGGSISSIRISKSENLARLRVSTSSSPSDIYLYNFETGDLKRLTNSLNSNMDANDLVEGQVVRYESFDGLQIPSIYYQPKQATADNKVPALVWVHGGPGGQSRLGYFELIQYLVNHGYAVIAVNNRGSSGYGKEFNHLDDLNHGDGDLKDCIAAKEFLASTGVVDTEKIGIIGGSYGGYMTMAALTFTPDEFEVGVNIFGVTNWLRTLNSIPPYWESYRQALYDEIGDPTTEDSLRLYEISPLFHAENVTKPLMVLQGANDVRVLQVESDEIVEKVKANGVPVEYIIFDDEGHGFLKKDNEIEGYGKIKVFLDQYLKGMDMGGSDAQADSTATS